MNVRHDNPLTLLDRVVAKGTPGKPNIWGPLLDLICGREDQDKGGESQVNRVARPQVFAAVENVDLLQGNPLHKIGPFFVYRGERIPDHARIL